MAKSTKLDEIQLQVIINGDRAGKTLGDLKQAQKQLNAEINQTAVGSEAYLKKHPEMRAKDQEATRRACAKFALIPTSVTNFMEGTRFTPAKHARQQSPYRYLLKPKAGGVALALHALGDKFHSILDVTIVYPDGIPGFWSFLCCLLYTSDAADE